MLALAFSPDGSRLAVGGQGTVGLLDGHTFRRIAAPQVPDVEFAQLAFSPDGHELVATATSTSTAPIRPVPSVLLRFDARTGRRVGRPHTIAAPGALADVLAFSPDGRRLITAAGGTLFAPETRAIIAPGDRFVVVRDARTLRPLHRFPALAFAGAVSPDARTFAIGGQDGSVSFLDLRTGKRRTASGRHAGAVQSAVFTSDGRFLVTVGDDAERDRLGRPRRAGDRDVPRPRRPRARGGSRPACAHALHRKPGRQRHRVGSQRGPAAGSDIPGRNGKR